MNTKVVLVVCSLGLLIQSALSVPCTSRAAVETNSNLGGFGWGSSYAYNGLNAPYAFDGVAANWGGLGLGYDGIYPGGLNWGGLGYDGIYPGAIAGPSAWNGLAGCGGRGLAYDGLPGAIAGPYAFDGLAGWAGRGLAYDVSAFGAAPGILGSPWAADIDFTPTSGGGLIVSSSSPLPPSGISVFSENAYDGILNIAGEVPFVGTTGIEGILPTVGAGAVRHGCGDGINVMVSEPAAFGSAPGILGAAPGILGAAPGVLGAASGFLGAPWGAPSACGCGGNWLW